MDGCFSKLHIIHLCSCDFLLPCERHMRMSPWARHCIANICTAPVQLHHSKLQTNTLLWGFSHKSCLFWPQSFDSITLRIGHWRAAMPWPLRTCALQLVLCGVFNGRRLSGWLACCTSIAACWWERIGAGKRVFIGSKFKLDYYFIFCIHLSLEQCSPTAAVTSYTCSQTLALSYVCQCRWPEIIENMGTLCNDTITNVIGNLQCGLVHEILPIELQRPGILLMLVVKRCSILSA